MAPLAQMQHVQHIQHRQANIFRSISGTPCPAQLRLQGYRCLRNKRLRAWRCNVAPPPSPTPQFQRCSLITQLRVQECRRLFCRATWASCKPVQHRNSSAGGGMQGNTNLLAGVYFADTGEKFCMKCNCGECTISLSMKVLDAEKHC